MRRRLRCSCRLSPFAAVALAVLASACGSTSSSNSASSSGSASAAVSTSSSAGGTQAANGVEQAATALKAGAAPPVFKAPGPSFKVAPDLKGKTIWYIANGLNFTFSQSLVAGVKDAARFVGMKVTAVDEAGQPAKGANLIQEGISQHVAAIIIQAFPTASVAGAVRSAKSAGIPVIQFDDGEGPVSPAAKADGVFANVAASYTEAGVLLADLVVAKTNGHADVAFIDVPDIQTTLNEETGFKQRLAQLCPTCKLHIASSPVAQWGSLSQLASSLLKADPSINFLVPALDAMVPAMTPAVYAAGAQNRVLMASNTVTKATLAPLKKGQLVAGGVGNPEEWIGYAMMDEALRALSHQPPVPNEGIPSRMFTHENVQGLDLDAPSYTWYGTTDFRGGYTKLWR